MNSKQLDLIEFKNRIWLFFVLIPISFALFILTFIVYFIIRTDENAFWFLMTFLIFTIEMQLLKIAFSKFRYVPNGQLTFNEIGIFKNKSSNNFNYNWAEIDELKFYYRGDRFWRTKLGSLTINRGRRRYHNLHWFGKKGLDKKILDRIDINGEIIYVKIRNERERDIFEDLISLSKKKDCHVKVIDTDFTTKVFGKTISI